MTKAKSKETSGLYNLNAEAMVKGIGRKATDEELMEYLQSDADKPPINLNDAFAKYQTIKSKTSKS